MTSAFSRAADLGDDADRDIESQPQSPRRGLVRWISPAVLNLERVIEQNRQRTQKKDGSIKAPGQIPTPQTKGKPRLLLMGQRRYESQLSCADRSLTNNSPKQERQVIHLERGLSQAAPTRDVISRVDGKNPQRFA